MAKTIETNNYQLLLDNGSKIDLNIPSNNHENIWPEFEAAMINRRFFYADSLGCEASLNGEILTIINAGRIIGVTN
jgi:hypothetical protein